MRTRLWQWAAVAAVAGIVSQASASVLVSDSFGLSGGSRVAGGSLSGLTLETSGQNWTTGAAGAGGTMLASGGADGGSDAGYVRPQSANTSLYWAGTGFVPVSGHDYVLEADLKPAAGDPSYWIGLGFQSSINTYIHNTGNGPFALLTVNGGVVAFADGTNHTLYSNSSAASGFVAGGSNHMTLQFHYDDTVAANNTLQVSINDVAVGASALQLPVLPNIAYVGFQLVGQSVNSGVDNFKLSDVTVPEPASLGLVGTGGLLLSKRRR